MEALGTAEHWPPAFGKRPAARTHRGRDHAWRRPSRSTAGLAT
ncbi:hypothetical protein I541_5762 [Mycobacteroides abscessus]|nr:hypothetical protein I541_5762 [Mycobacteroides abscessus]